MPPRQARGAKRAAEASKAPAKRARTSSCGTARQPIELNKSQQLPPRTSPCKALAIATSQAIKERPFESQLRDLLPKDTAIEPLRAATKAITEDTKSAIEGLNALFKDDFEGIN